MNKALLFNPSVSTAFICSQPLGVTASKHANVFSPRSPMTQLALREPPQPRTSLTQLFSELEEFESETVNDSTVFGPELSPELQGVLSNSQLNSCAMPSEEKDKALSTEKYSTQNKKDNFAAQLRALLKMARPNSAPMGGALIGLGAFGARGLATFPLDATTKARLALSTLLTVLVTSSSMIVNDYYDFKNGVDTPETKPWRPLVTGEIKPETVKQALGVMDFANKAMMCMLGNAPMGLWVLASSTLTDVYTEHLKPITGVKNATCATIVAMALGLGAMAMTGTPRALASVWRPMAVLAGTICHREMVMDIKDAEGDAKTGVQTVPVVFGKNRALSISMAPLALALAVSATAPGKTKRLVASAAMLAQAALALDSKRRNFDRPSLVRAIEIAPVWLLAAIVSLTA